MVRISLPPAESQVRTALTWHAIGQKLGWRRASGCSSCSAPCSGGCGSVNQQPDPHSRARRRAKVSRRFSVRRARYAIDDDAGATAGEPDRRRRAEPGCCSGYDRARSVECCHSSLPSSSCNAFASFRSGVCVETLSEPAVNWCEEIASFGTAALVAAEPGKAHCGAQLSELGLLLLGDAQGFAVEFLGGFGLPPDRIFRGHECVFRCPFRNGPQQCVQTSAAKLRLSGPFSSSASKPCQQPVPGTSDH